MTKVKSEALEVVPPRQPMDIESLIGKAVQAGADIATLERLLALSKEINADAAKAEFFTAFAAFQAECPPIPRNKAVKKDGKTRYKFAPLDDILKIAGPILAKHGFSHTEDCEINIKDKELLGISKIHHVGGHTKESSFKVPIGSEFMSQQQQMGAAMTFAKRYAFVNNTGLAYADEDTDAVDDVPFQKNGGGKVWQERMDNPVRPPSAKSDRKPTGEPRPSDRQVATARGLHEAKTKDDRIPPSTLKTVEGQMKKLRMTEGAFDAAFGFPLANLDKHSLNSVLDWVKEHQP